MAETIGQLVDRLAELELHRWHVEQLMRDPACLPAQFDTCQEHLQELDRQRSQLQRRISRLWEARQSGSDDPEARATTSATISRRPPLQAVDSNPELRTRPPDDDSED